MNRYVHLDGTIFRWDRLVSPAKFLAQSRSTLILHAFGSGVMLLSAFIVTISGESTFATDYLLALT